MEAVLVENIMTPLQIGFFGFSDRNVTLAWNSGTTHSLCAIDVKLEESSVIQL